MRDGTRNSVFPGFDFFNVILNATIANSLTIPVKVQD